MVEFEPSANVFRSPAGEGALVLWADGTVLSVNATAARALGRTRSHLLGRALGGLGLAPLDADGLPLAAERYPWRLVVDTGLGAYDVVVGLPSGDVTHWWSVSCRPLVDDDGRVTGVVCTMDEVAAPAALVRPASPAARPCVGSAGADVIELESLARVAGLVLPEAVHAIDSPWARRAG